MMMMMMMMMMINQSEFRYIVRLLCMCSILRCIFCKPDKFNVSLSTSSEFGVFWSVFSRSRTEYGDLQVKSPYLVRMSENKDQKKSEFGHLSGGARKTITKLEKVLIFSLNTYSLSSWSCLYSFF